jgi:hypothetical protein
MTLRIHTDRALRLAAAEAPSARTARRCSSQTHSSSWRTSRTSTCAAGSTDKAEQLQAARARVLGDDDLRESHASREALGAR